MKNRKEKNRKIVRIARGATTLVFLLFFAACNISFGAVQDDSTSSYVSEENIKPTHEFIQYMGRVDFSDPLKPRLFAPGTTIITKFKGTYCQFIINDQNSSDTKYNYLEIVIDNGPTKRIRLNDGINNIDYIKDLTDTVHTISITKNTEADIGYIEFLGFRCDELIEPDPLPNKRIEFIGNSITCGFGVDNSQIDCGKGDWYDQNSAYYAYGPIAARKLVAQWMLSSVSGIGLIHSCCNKTYTMPDVYQNISLMPSGKKWDFSKYKSDIVCICLGQNDGIQDSTAFCSAYVEFIGTIRQKNPGATIICLTSPMADSALFNAHVNYLIGIVDFVNSKGDENVYKLFLSHGLNSGCDWHLNKEENILIADKLQTFIKEIKEW